MARESALEERERQDREKAEDIRARQLRLGDVVEEEKPKSKAKAKSKSKSEEE